MALTSIYDGQFTVLPHSGKGYRVKLEVNLPGPYRIREPHEGWLLSCLHFGAGSRPQLDYDYSVHCKFYGYGKGGRIFKAIYLWQLS